MEEGLEKLGHVAGCVLVHDRPVVRPVDDSVVRVTDGRTHDGRRARGYAPRPVWRTSAAAPDVLALGAGLKNTICWLKRGVAVMSQHLGDLSSAASLNAFERTVEALGRTLDAVPQVIAVDAHPDGPTFALAGVWRGSGMQRLSLCSIIRLMCWPAPWKMKRRFPLWA